MGNLLWRTPPAYFREQWEKYRFTVDAAADDDNALVRPSNFIRANPSAVVEVRPAPSIQQHQS